MYAVRTLIQGTILSAVTKMYWMIVSELATSELPSLAKAMAERVESVIKVIKNFAARFFIIVNLLSLFFDFAEPYH